MDNVAISKMATREFLAEMQRQFNDVRRNPKGLIPDVQRTNYSQAIKDEVINFLNSVRPCTNNVVVDPFLSQSAQAWANQQGAAGTTGHGPFEARSDYIYDNVGTYTSISENLSYGFTRASPAPGYFPVSAYQGCVYYSDGRESCSSNTTTAYISPRETLLQLIIDDKVPNKGHRKNIYDCKIATIGVGVAAHKEFRVMVSFLHASGWLPRS